MLGLVFGDDDDEEKERLSYKSPPPPPSLVISPVTDQGVVTVDFYLYRPNSVLLNELFLFWNRNRLVSHNSILFLNRKSFILFT